MEKVCEPNAWLLTDWYPLPTVMLGVAMKPEVRIYGGMPRVVTGLKLGKSCGDAARVAVLPGVAVTEVHQPGRAERVRL